MDDCYRTLYCIEDGAGIFRTNQHLNMVLKQKVREGRLYDAAIAFDYLKRGNKKTTNPEEAKKYTVNLESWDLVTQILIDRKEYEFLTLVQVALDTDKKMLLSDELRKVLKEYVAKADFDGLHNHLILRGPKSKNIIEQEEIQFKKKKAIIESLKKNSTII